MAVDASKKKLEKMTGFDYINLIVLFLFTLLVAYPLYFVIIASFSDPTMVNNGKVMLIPRGLNFDGYKRVFSNEMIWIGYGNTILYTVAGTTLSVFVTLLAGYTLSRPRFLGKGFLTFFFYNSMYISGGIIPLFVLIQELNLYDTRWVMILLGTVNVFNLIICRTFMQNSIPHELFESANLDGASHFTYFRKVVLPLSKPIIAVLVLYFGVAHWNDYMKGLIYIRSASKEPLQIVLRKILILSDVGVEMMDAEEAMRRLTESELMKYALIIVSTLPILMVYPFVQKHFVQGVMIGSVKG